MKYIYLPPDKKNELLRREWPTPAGRRRVSFVTLQSALKFRTHTPLADMLRMAAMACGGVVYDSVPSAPGPLAEAECFPGGMRFRFSGSLGHSYVAYSYRSGSALVGRGLYAAVYERVTPLRLLAVFRAASRLCGLRRTAGAAAAPPETASEIPAAPPETVFETAAGIPASPPKTASETSAPPPDIAAGIPARAAETGPAGAGVPAVSAFRACLSGQTRPGPASEIAPPETGADKPFILP